MKQKRISLLSSIVIPVALSLMTVGCGTGGGGGGGDNFIGAAEINLTASPNSIDTKDRTQVKVRIAKVIDTGILLKIRFPSKLTYAVNTSMIQLQSEDQGRPSEPSFSGSNNDYSYLVYFMPRSAFGDLPQTSEDTSEPATLTFELIGNGRISDGKIEADADVNDPTIDDSVEFDVTAPAFEAETDASIEVSQTKN